MPFRLLVPWTLVALACAGAEAVPETIALKHVRVIDGTGAPAREDQTVVIEGGRITAVGATAVTPSRLPLRYWICRVGASSRVSSACTSTSITRRGSTRLAHQPCFR
ncbi:MAG TPA: hypothetical protein VG799_08320 [Gemmatimonadota bacterium]|nr:hypothetical protein [Gemmatimonadota bacterium]